MLFNGAKPQSPFSSRNQTKQALRTQCCKMGHSPKPLSHHEIKLNKHCVRNAVKWGQAPNLIFFMNY